MTTAAANPAQPPQPEVLGGVVPYLTVDGALRAAEFYKKAFDGEVVASHPVDEQGRTMHVHLYINGGSLMLSDGYPEQGHPVTPHQGFSLTLRVDQIDRRFKQAVDAGAEVVMPVELMFWGERYGQLRDPFGVLWAMVSPA
ncbi:MAG: VOC family protein [Caulobacteraceae bacterium]|nr:VOC family protein [Caulobacteraceae bacterium]